MHACKNTEKVQERRIKPYLKKDVVLNDGEYYGNEGSAQCFDCHSTSVLRKDTFQVDRSKHWLRLDHVYEIVSVGLLLRYERILSRRFTPLPRYSAIRTIAYAHINHSTELKLP